MCSCPRQSDFYMAASPRALHLTGVSLSRPRKLVRQLMWMNSLGLSGTLKSHAGRKCRVMFNLYLVAAQIGNETIQLLHRTPTLALHCPGGSHRGYLGGPAALGFLCVHSNSTFSSLLFLFQVPLESKVTLLCPSGKMNWMTNSSVV